MSAYSQDILSSAGRFINSASTAVLDNLLGLLLSNPSVGLLDYGKVVVRRDYGTSDIVKIISGGASGHEPAHAGFVGRGMLTAAVQGDFFSSPATGEVLRTIREVSHKQDSGVLVIIQNDTADRLNFGLAVERARSEGIFVKLLVVSDDCCTSDDHFGNRGLTGIVLLNKIAGAMAETGCDLENTFTFCEKLQENLSSIVLSLSSGTSPTLETCICAKHLCQHDMEIGSGLRGEPGAKKMTQTSVSEAVNILLSELLSENFVLNANTPVVVLINNLGNTLQMEENIFIKEMINCLLELEVTVARIYHGRFITSLDVRGFTVTILKVFDIKVLEYLDFPSDAPSWGTANFQHIPKGLCSLIPSRVKNRKRPTPPGVRLTEAESNIVILAVQFACDALISCEKQLNTIDAESGRGNVGWKMKRFASTVLGETKDKMLTYYHPRVFFDVFSLIAEKTITGTLSFLYGVLFEAAANSFKKLPENHSVGVDDWVACLDKASETLKSCGKVEFGLGTMYDPLHACVVTLKNSINKVSPMEAFGLGVAAAEDAVQQTRLPLKKHPDPGAFVVGIWLRAAYEGMKMRCGD